MIVVCSLYRPRLEDFLAGRGDDLLAVVPESVGPARVAAGPPYPVKTVARWDDDRELARLADELRALGVSAVATIDEPCVRAAAVLRELLGLPGQDPDSAVACTDKAVMKQWLAAAWVPVAEHRIVNSVAEIGGFLDETGGDIVVKPRCGFGTINTHRVSRENLAELVATGAFDPPGTLPEFFGSTTLVCDLGRVSYLAERYVDVVAEYHCELLLHDGEEVHCIAGRYCSPVLSENATGSVLLDPETPEAVAVCELTRASAAALGVRSGFGHCEVFRDSSGRWLVGEFASRPGGGMIPRMLQLSHGIDNLALLAEQIAGRSPRAEVDPARRRWIAWRSVSVSGTGIITGVPDPVDLLRLPGVVEARVAVRPGDPTTGLQAAMTHAAYLLCEGDSAEHAEQLVAEAVAACRFVVEPALVAV